MLMENLFYLEEQLSRPLSDSKMEEKGCLASSNSVLVLSQKVVETRSNVVMVALSQYAKSRG